MANYYQYKFVSPEPLFARVKEEMRSYFSSGLIDDTMFGIYLNDALRKLGKGTLNIKNAMLFIDCFQATLPPTFSDVRECWATWTISPPAVRVAGAYYEQITTTINKPYDACNPLSICDPCHPEVVQVTQKTNTYISQSPCRLKHLLTPGNQKTREMCGAGSLNIGINGTDQFTIEGNKLTTEFREGDIYLVYYVKEEDCSGNQLIPENYRVEQFILAYLKAKLYEFLWNTNTDETYNQAMQKWQVYQQMSDEAFIMAQIEMRKQTMYQKAYGIFRDTHRNDVYERVMHGSIYNRGFRRGRF